MRGKQYHYQVKYYAINKFFSVKGRNMEFLLNDLGIETRGSNMFCPFHDDDVGGKPSAKYHPDSDTLYCFTESKVFTAYHVLKILYAKDMNKIFEKVWENLTEEEQQDLLTKHGEDVRVTRREYISPIWLNLYEVLYKFKMGEVDFRQHKNALFKVLSMVSEAK